MVKGKSWEPSQFPPEQESLSAPPYDIYICLNTMLIHCSSLANLFDPLSWRYFGQYNLLSQSRKQRLDSQRISRADLTMCKCADQIPAIRAKIRFPFYQRPYHVVRTFVRSSVIPVAAEFLVSSTIITIRSLSGCKRFLACPVVALPGHFCDS